MLPGGQAHGFAHRARAYEGKNLKTNHRAAHQIVAFARPD